MRVQVSPGVPIKKLKETLYLVRTLTINKKEKEK